jgi:DNA-binding transcriptional ArsR family regulator
MDDIGLMFKALGDPTRRRMFEFLCAKCEPVAVSDSGEVRPVQGVTVGEVCCHITGGEQVTSTLSFHLKELRLAGLVQAERQGKFTVVSVRPESIARMTNYLSTLRGPRQLDPCAAAPALLHKVTQ